ncbi:ferrous iron transport protein B [uncultured Porphyromonas sp.]|uniref:ferrous iron transport protein B n=1 Tax=uncultured Porphyromonas sp. TaxID=159274 RepID=UPI00261D3963|nr:ferrous iron transport protein B [uncultured Porphyromonas sp.]
MKLSELHNGDRARILSVGGHGAFRKRILEMGFVQGQVVEVIQAAPLRDPIYYRLMDYNVSLRRKEAGLITVELIDPGSSSEELPPLAHTFVSDKRDGSPTATTVSDDDATISRSIRVALIGNPNSGKTTLFNHASGAHERVGNYSGVTVEAKEAHFDHQGIRYELIDLPGTYSLSPYSPEELYIRDYLTNEETRPDVVIDVLDATNLERQLYLAVQVREMGIPMVVALNMWDEFEQKKNQLDVQQLSHLLGTPMVPTICRKGVGISELFDKVRQLVDEDLYADRRFLQIHYGTDLEQSIATLQKKLIEHASYPDHLSPRYLAVKLLEGDPHTQGFIKQQPKGDFLLTATAYEENRLRKNHSNEEDLENYIINQRYGFIAGALRETYRPNKRRIRTLTDRIDNLLIHPVWGYPIFLAFLFIMFEATFALGAFPMDWIEQGVDALGAWVYGMMAPGPLRDLLVTGVIGGVGGVLVFLPNILILYLFISIMEDTGYMARATFLMDKLMHRMGLHGKSFIPLIMGFGCNVPAVMASRTIESRQSRIITVLVTSLMSCSARLPVYILIAGTFFPQHAGLVLFGLYALGVLLAFLMAKLFRRVLFKSEDLPFVMELPPYRIPMARAVGIHMWDKAREYLHKMGSVILVASVIIWALGYYPREEVMARADSAIAQVEQQSTLSESERSEQITEIERQAHMEQQESSYLGRIGQTVQPVLAPLGFDWKLSVALVAGLPAKEVVVSSLSVIYTGNETVDEESDDFAVGSSALSRQMRQEKDPVTGEPLYTPLIAICFLIFVLIYMPCVATVVAVSKELNSAWWGLFVVVYTCVLAWIVAYLARLIGLLII